VTYGAPTLTGLGTAVSTDQAGFYQITNITDPAGNAVAPSEYVSRIIYAGSPQGAALKAAQNLLTTVTVMLPYYDLNGNLQYYGPVIENVVAQDKPGLYSAGVGTASVGISGVYSGIPVYVGGYYNGEKVLQFEGTKDVVSLDGNPTLAYNQYLFESLGGPSTQYVISLIPISPANPTPAISGDPILDSTGATQIVNTDLTAGGFTGAWSVTRNWTPDATLVPDNTFGNAWMNQSQT
jgi:hypothetical protein